MCIVEIPTCVKRNAVIHSKYIKYDKNIRPYFLERDKIQSPTHIAIIKKSDEV